MRISTDRLDLLAPDLETWRALLEGEVNGALEGYPTDGDLVMARLVVDGHLPAGEWGPWQIRERVSGLLIGGAGFKGAPNETGMVEIGYGLAPQARGRGFATEAVRALVFHAFARGATAVTAEVDVGNEASARVVAACGFTACEVEAGADVRWWRCDRR